MADDPPISLAAHRALQASDAMLWSPADALRHFLARIDAGEVNPERMAIHYAERDADGGLTQYHVVAGLTYETHLCMLVMAQQALMDDWRR